MICPSVDDTHVLAATLAATLAKAIKDGQFQSVTIGLNGELGAGKTCLAQGIAAGLGISGPVTSPTFALVQFYEGGRLPFFHADFYRLGDVSEIEALGWEDVLAAEAVLAVEWANRFPSELPTDHLRLALGVLDAERRTLEVRAEGPTAAQLLERLRAE